MESHAPGRASVAASARLSLGARRGARRGLAPELEAARPVRPAPPSHLPFKAAGPSSSSERVMTPGRRRVAGAARVLEPPAAGP